MENEQPRSNVPPNRHLLAKVLEFSSWEQDPNTPHGSLGIEVQSAGFKLKDPHVLAVASRDPVLNILHTITLNHLKHVSLSFETEKGSEDYPHERVLAGAYPKRPSLIALHKAEEFFEIIEANDQQYDAFPFKPLDPDSQKALIGQQKSLMQDIYADPISSYVAFATRLANGGPNANFPEFSHNIEYLHESLLSNPSLETLCMNNKYMARFRQLVLTDMEGLLIMGAEGQLPYTGTIITMDRTLELFDVLQRVQMGNSAPDFYHSNRYEYYLHYLMAEKDHILFPTISSLSIRDLISLRGVPIGITGVTDSVVRVDGFPQTSYEFFHHDVDHARRKYQFFREEANKKGLTVQEFAEYSNKFVHNTLIPEIAFTPNLPEEEKDLKRAESMILFEVLNEDALVASPEVISSAIIQDILHKTPFERIEDNSVVYLMDLEASNITCLYQKLIGSFFDTPAKRNIHLGGNFARSKEGVIKAATRLLNLITPGHVPERIESKLESLLSVEDKLPFNKDNNQESVE